MSDQKPDLEKALNEALERSGLRQTLSETLGGLAKELSDIKWPNIEWPSLEKLNNENIRKQFSVPRINPRDLQIDSINPEAEKIFEEIAKERERKEQEERRFREQALQHLKAISENTANITLLVDLIRNNNEKQDEVIQLIAEILSLSKAKTKEEADSKFREIMNKINQFTTDVDSVIKLGTWLNTVYHALPFN